MTGPPVRTGCILRRAVDCAVAHLHYPIVPSVKISTPPVTQLLVTHFLVTQLLVTSLDPYRDASPLLPHPRLSFPLPAIFVTTSPPSWKRVPRLQFNTTCSGIFHPTCHLFTGQIGGLYLASLPHLPNLIRHILHRHRMKLDYLDQLSGICPRHLPDPRHTFDAN